MTNAADIEQYHLALREYGEGKLVEAIMRLEALTQRVPVYGDALEALGVLYERAGRLDDAIAAMKRLMEADPASVMAHTNLSRFYMLKGMIDEAEEEKSRAAIASFDRIAGRKSKAQMTPEELAAERLKEEERVTSERAYRARKIMDHRAMIGKFPEDAMLRYTLGELLLQQGERDAGMEALSQAIQLNPKHSVAYRALGRALEEADRLDEAREIYEKGIPVADQNGDIVPMNAMKNRLSRLPKKG